MVDATTELAAISELAKTEPVQAARRMTLALMRGNADEYKAGYSAENAVMAAADYVENLLDGAFSAPSYDEVWDALTPDPQGDDFVGFLHHLADELGGTTADVIYAVEKPRKFAAQYADYLTAQEPNTAGAPTPLEA